MTCKAIEFVLDCLSAVLCGWGKGALRKRAQRGMPPLTKANCAAFKKVVPTKGIVAKKPAHPSVLAPLLPLQRASPDALVLCRVCAAGEQRVAERADGRRRKELAFFRQPVAGAEGTARDAGTCTRSSRGAAFTRADRV